MSGTVSRPAGSDSGTALSTVSIAMYFLSASEIHTTMPLAFLMVGGIRARDEAALRAVMPARRHVVAG